MLLLASITLLIAAAEIERGMKLMGVRNVGELSRENLRWR
jgi:isopentenyl diphosphate isomerase/L-lactate dehydrogenase-like FMN-dependent dehydrogenase